MQASSVNHWIPCTISCTSCPSDWCPAEARVAVCGPAFPMPATRCSPGSCRRPRSHPSPLTKRCGLILERFVIQPVFSRLFQHESTHSEEAATTNHGDDGDQERWRNAEEGWLRNTWVRLLAWACLIVFLLSGQITRRRRPDEALVEHAAVAFPRTFANLLGSAQSHAPVRAMSLGFCVSGVLLAQGPVSKAGVVATSDPHPVKLHATVRNRHRASTCLEAHLDLLAIGMLRPPTSEAS